MSFRRTIASQNAFARAARHCLLTACAIMSIASDVPAAGLELADAEEERWYLYRLAGQDAGHLHESILRTANSVTTDVETLIVINRLGSKVEIKGRAVFTETADGRLQSVRGELSSSRQTTTLDVRVEANAVAIKTSTGGKEYPRKLEYTGVLVGPWGIQRQTVSGLSQKGDTVICQTLMVELERLTKITRKLVDKQARLPGSGPRTTCARIEERLEGYPAVRAVWVDSEGRMVRQTETGPFGESEVTLVDRATALRAHGGTLPEEMFDRTLVRANIRLPGPRSLDRLVAKLRQRDPSVGWPEFSGPGQTILRRDANDLLLEVRRLQPERAASRPDAGNGLPEYLEPNAIVQSDDREVRRIAREVAGGEADAFGAARRLRDWVSRNMKLDMGIALAPASEVIRQRKGTCMAYAVALASLARAAGIPSRVVMGYVYVSGIWGGHAWVEILAGGQWLALDAALPSAGTADAARIACGRASLAEGPGSLLVALTRIAGNVEVSIVEYEFGGTTTKVSASDRSFTIEHDTYRNPWLGLEVRKPVGFRFVKTDAVYPDSTVVAIESPTGKRVDVRQEDASIVAGGDSPGIEELRSLGFSQKPNREQVAGRDVLVIEGPEKGAMAFVQGADLWILVAVGQSAGELLRQQSALMTIHPQER
jgi:transglutaminase-like putative cysteine protease